MCKCRVCESSSLKEVYDNQLDSNYYFCEVCEFIFQEEDEIVSIEEEKEVYDQHDNSFESEGYVKMFERFIEKAVDPFISGNIKKALDYGCGPGPVLAKILEKKGLDVNTFDPIYDNNSEYKNFKYDLITSTEVFEHFIDPLNELEKISNLLKKNGILSIMTLLRPDTEEQFKNWWYKRDKTHISFYSSKTLYLLGKMHNLEMIYNDNKRLITFKKI